MEGSLPADFSESACDGLVEALDWSYREALDRMGDTPGLDEQWYGITVYKLAGPRLGYALRNVPHATVRPVGVTYEVFLGRQHIRYNKLRGSTVGGVRFAFPRPSRAAQRMADLNQAQLELALGSPGGPVVIRPLVDMGTGTPTEWVLGHTGSSQAGLTSVYLCAPAIAVDGEIREWRTWIPLFHDGKSMPASTAVPTPGLPEPVEIEEPALRFRIVDPAVQRDAD